VTTSWSSAASVVAWVTGLGFGLPGLYGTWYFATHGEVWRFLGFPTYGEGPFDRVGVEMSVPLLLAFLLICAAELVSGWWLWRGRAMGGGLALALLPFEFTFWLGFALPLGPLLGGVRTVFVLLDWRAARRRERFNPT